jgi:hypothetical protein
MADMVREGRCDNKLQHLRGRLDEAEFDVMVGHNCSTGDLLFPTVKTPTRHELQGLEFR